MCSSGSIVDAAGETMLDNPDPSCLERFGIFSLADKSDSAPVIKNSLSANVHIITQQKFLFTNLLSNQPAPRLRHLQVCGQIRKSIVCPIADTCTSTELIATSNPQLFVSRFLMSNVRTSF